MERQCKGHLNIAMSELAQAHLKELAKWVQIGGALVMDAAKAADLGKKIAAM